MLHIMAISWVTKAQKSKILIQEAPPSTEDRKLNKIMDSLENYKKIIWANIWTSIQWLCITRSLKSTMYNLTALLLITSHANMEMVEEVCIRSTTAPYHQWQIVLSLTLKTSNWLPIETHLMIINSKISLIPIILGTQANQETKWVISIIQPSKITPTYSCRDPNMDYSSISRWCIIKWDWLTSKLGGLMYVIYKSLKEYL
jgi:hypothetical protein